MNKSFKRDIRSLDSIFEFLDEFVTTGRLDQSTSFKLKFVVEELFTNMVKYNSGSVENITVDIGKEENGVVIRLTDPDAKPFDISKAPEVDVHQPLDKRKAGGLGLHLTKLMVDEINYEHHDNQTQITLVKHLEK